MSELQERSEWKRNPEDNEWNHASNWKDDKIPEKTAIFSDSEKTNIKFSDNSELILGKIEFSKTAPSYNFEIRKYCDEPALTIDGEGIVNHSKRQQCLSVYSKGVSHDKPQLKFANKASAGGYDMLYNAGPESLEDGYGGGVIGFVDESTAGSAFFTVRTGKQAPPRHNSTVGAEVSFNDSSNADKARFTIFGTLGSDGDTFGNVAFHDESSAKEAVFTNIGGTVSGGDGGNTQFFDNSTAANGTYNNYGGNVKKANGGDVAFDSVATGANGVFYNRAARASGAYGGVTSFNNNPPSMGNKGATAGTGTYHNYGASQDFVGGGGHTEFTAKYGCPDAGKSIIHNYGSAINNKSTAGHTIFSISLPTDNFPSAANALIYNYPSPNKDGVGGFTEFNIYQESKGHSISNPDPDRVPTASNATFLNLGGNVDGAEGGFTSFSDKTSSGSATLIAYGGINGGYGGRIIFSDEATGGSANVILNGNGELDLSYYKGSLNIGNLVMNGGVISCQLGKNGSSLTINKKLEISCNEIQFKFYIAEEDTLEANTKHTVLSAKNLSDFKSVKFKANSYNGIDPVFSIEGDKLMVSYNL